jgi:serine/threonine protein kinase
MAPEQARGRPVDRRADLWAFGAVLFEMLTGRRAFQGDSSLTEPRRKDKIPRTLVRQSDQDVTALMQAWVAGDLGPSDLLMPLVYDDRGSAPPPACGASGPRYAAADGAGFEVYVRLVVQRQAGW